MDAYVLLIALAVISTINGGGITITWSQKQLTEIPNKITTSVEILLLNSNCIKQISVTDFQHLPV